MTDLIKKLTPPLLFVGMLFGTLVCQAQELKFSIIEDIEPNPLDMTAREENRNDGDGYAYAIIKVTSDIEDDDLSKFNFSFGYIKSEKEMHDGELWIYVARGAKTMDIRREGYKPILKHSFKAIKEGTTYTMKLSVQTPKVKYRVLQFKVEPANENAIVKVKPENEQENYELWGTVDVNGSINRRIETGVYLYEVSADNYLSSQGRVILTANADGDNFVENVTLTPNYGFLEIDDSHGIAGAEVYIDDKKVGKVPFRSQRMECRDDYRLMISGGEFYKTFTATFAITRGNTTKLSPMLEANFATTTIKVDGGAEIFINGERKGRGSWSGPLLAGGYDVECRLPNHTSTTKQINVTADVAETFLMDMPTPIVGSLYINTNPSGAKIIIDDKDEGLVTPREINNLLVGQHQVTLTLANHRTETREVSIHKDETAELDVTLSDMANMTIESVPSSASLFINGKYVGVTPYKAEMASGDYQFKFEKDGFRTLAENAHLDSSSPVQKFSLQRQYQPENQIYLQPMLQVGGYTSIGGTLGFCFGRVNLESDCLWGLSHPTIYWNKVTGGRPEEDELAPMYYGAKFGYNVFTGTRLRITPQLGGGYLMVSGTMSSCYAVNGTFGVRFDYAVANHLSLVAVPEYGFSITESDTFKRIAETSSKVKGWVKGFNLRFGFSVYL